MPHWHRLLFARFLAERGLLRHPEHNIPVSLEDCRELAEAEGLTDAWAVAERYSATMLPAVFHTEDPVLALSLDPVHTQKLNHLVRALDPEIFQADDSLGWTYQYWRAAEKEAINASGVKIGADELPAVTQLFTEPYMVRFLLHNSLGAWWAGNVLAANPALTTSAKDEDALRAACALPGYSFDMLRFVRERTDGPWRPAAGAFPGWPKQAKAITILDPCCGSGHFLTEALTMLAALRQAEEGLSPADAVAAVLRENLHGLEIDGRCVQIAAFAVAITAWRIGGWQMLPLPHIAWVGAPPPLLKSEFVDLAEDNLELEYALGALHDLFAQAPLLGSFLKPTGGDLFESEKLREIERLIEPLIKKARRAEPEKIEGVIAARGMSDAAALLHRKFTLQATNVPFLGKNKQESTLQSFLKSHFPMSKDNLATSMIDRMIALSSTGGTICYVSPQEWYFSKTLSTFRTMLLRETTLNLISDLGPAAFRDMNWWAARTAIGIFTNAIPTESSSYIAIDADTERDLDEKISRLSSGKMSHINQLQQGQDPYASLSLEPYKVGPKLADYADTRQGIGTADMEQFIVYFWEVSNRGELWARYQTAPENGADWSGKDRYLKWEDGKGALATSPQARVCGQPAWDRKGLAVAVNRELPRTIYTGEKFDCTVAIIVPKKDEYYDAIASCVLAEDFGARVRGHDQALSVTESSFGKIDFDWAYWQEKARAGVAVLSEPYSTDPGQWIFHGHPEDSKIGTSIHVALARLCGYKWPAEVDHEIRLSEKARDWVAMAKRLPGGDGDGLLGVPAVAGEKSLADRLRSYLSTSFGPVWSDALERRLVAEADEVFDKKVARDGSIDAWLADRAFRQHCILFGQRPFLWHISDGLKGGFSVYIHYHRFDQAALRKLTYTMLGDWLARAKAENNALRYEKGRELQQALERVLEGEKPYDIFVRWKSLAEQPLGWNPDLNDGVRQNIRPFITAGILTSDLSKTLKEKDRGNDLPSAPWFPVFKGNRINDYHTTLAEKLAAREAGKKRATAK
jgi:hypothetical protein